MNLLVVDFDFFFPMPQLSSSDWMLYDWSHSESEFYRNIIWPTRAEAFIMNGLDLPMVQGYQGFWDRFKFNAADDQVLYFSDSNVYALDELVFESWSGRFEHVWLFDAHHDSGYKASAKEIKERGTWTCEDWMIAYKQHHKSVLHVRYPQWKTDAFKIEPQPRVKVDRQFDDGQPLDVVFDRVFVCRSGAWVPPWCDHQFMEFISDAGLDIEEVGECPERPFDIEQARQVAAMKKEMLFREVKT